MKQRVKNSEQRRARDTSVELQDIAAMVRASTEESNRLIESSRRVVKQTRKMIALAKRPH